MLLAVLRLIFALKREIAPPQTKIAPPKIVRWEVEVGVSGQKNALNFGEDLFFWRSLDFGQKKALNLRQSSLNKLKIRTCSFSAESNFKKSPPPLRNPGYATANVHYLISCYQCFTRKNKRTKCNNFLNHLKLCVMSSVPQLKRCSKGG